MYYYWVWKAFEIVDLWNLDVGNLHVSKNIGRNQNFCFKFSGNIIVNLIVCNTVFTWLDAALDLCC